MHLAALVPQTPHASTYFAGVVAVVGGGPPKEKAHTEKHGLKTSKEPTLSLINSGRISGFKFHVVVTKVRREPVKTLGNSKTIARLV